MLVRLRVNGLFTVTRKKVFPVVIDTSFYLLLLIKSEIDFCKKTFNDFVDICDYLFIDLKAFLHASI